MDIRQIIFWAYDTAITDGIARKIQLRITINSRDPERGQRRGRWDTDTDYVLDDYVYTVDGTTHVPTRWFCTTPNHGNDPTTVGSTYWTQADFLDEWACADPAKVLIIPGLSRRLVGRPSPISAHPTKEQGELTPESFEITLRDFFDLTSADGAVDGTGAPVTIDWLSSEWKSFLNQLFSNPDALTTWYWNQIIDDTAVYTDYADKTKFDLYWTGDSNNRLNSTPTETVLGEEGENALQIQEIHVTVDSFATRLQSFTVRDFLDTVSASDSMLQRRAFFGNYVTAEGKTTTDSGTIALPVDFNTVGQPLLIDLAAMTINDNLHWAPYEDIIVKMFALARCATNATQWRSKIQPWKDSTNQTSLVVESDRVAYYADHTWMATTGVMFERKFCIDYRCDFAVQEETFSDGFSWDTSIGDIIKKWLVGWACKLDNAYDQTTKQPLVLPVDIFDAAALVIDATTAPVSTGDMSISVTDAGALTAASRIIEISDDLNEEYMVASPSSGGTLTIAIRPNPVAFASGAIVRAIQQVPSARSGLGNWNLTKSVREQQNTEGSHIEAKSATDEDTLQSPNQKGKAIPKESSERTKAFNPIGTNTQWKQSFHTYDANETQDKQQSFWRSWTGGRQARHIVADDATITLVDNTHPHHNVYTVQSNSSTFSYLNKVRVGDPLWSFWDDPSTDVIFFSNGAFGVVVFDDIVLTDGQNSILVVVNQFQSPNPPVVGGIGATATNESIYIGFDGIFSNFNLTGGLTTATIPGDLTGQSIFKNTWKGMQFIFPKYGVFTLQDVGGYSGGVTPCTFDRSFPVDDAAAWARAGGPSFNSSCRAAVFMYYDNSLDKRYHPNLYSNTYSNQNYDIFKTYTSSPPTSGPAFFAGAYSVNRLNYGLPKNTQNPSVPVPPDDSHGCESYTIAQVNAEFSIGNFTKVTRYYNGVTAPDGRISSVRNGMMWYEQRESDAEHPIRFYQVIGRDIDTFSLGRGETVLHCIEKKPRRNISRHKVWVKGRNTTSGGAGTVGGASGVEGGGTTGPSSTGTVDLGGALLQKPNTPGRNTTVPAIDGVRHYEGRRRSTSNTDDFVAFWDNDGTTNLYAVDFNGNIFQRQGALSLANGDNDNVDISTYASYLITGPTLAFAIRGLAAPTLSGSPAYRLPVTITNTVAQTLTLKNNDSGSAAGNRLRIPGGDVTILQHESFTVEYDLTNAEWIVTSVGKAPVTTPTDMVVTDPIASQNIQPTVNGAVGLQFKSKSGDTADINRWYDASGTLKGLVAYTGEIDWKYTINIAPIADVQGLIIDKANTDSTNSQEWKMNGSTVAYVTKDGNFYGFDFHGSTFYGTTVTLTGSATSVDITNSATAASNTTIISVANSGSGGRGQFALNSNGSVVFGPLDKNSGLTKGFAISGNLSTPDHTITATGPTTLDGAYHFVILNTASNNVTVKLPAHITNGGPEFIFYKSSANNTATVQDSTGAAVKAWTAVGTAFTMKDDGTTWRAY